LLNWRPVVDYELREIANKHRMKQLESEIERLDELNSKIDALLFSSSTNSTPPQNIPGNSAG